MPGCSFCLMWSVKVFDSPWLYAVCEKYRTKVAKFQAAVFPDPAAGTDIPISIKERRAVPLVCKVPSQLLRSDRGSEDQLLLQSAECLTWLFMESCTGAPPHPAPLTHTHIFTLVTRFSHV